MVKTVVRVKKGRKVPPRYRGRAVLEFFHELLWVSIELAQILHGAKKACENEVIEAPCIRPSSFDADWWE